MVGLVCCTLQIEGIVSVDNLEHCHVLRHLLLGFALLLKAPHIIVAVEGKVVARAHNHGLVGRLQGLLGQMTALIVE